ncbi:hypothetical protein F4782DRAFT_532942 [Xylaria castorea]|nr:hypothetical protein F4782DRAFT_532942 [Xylaria castorea]
MVGVASTGSSSPLDKFEHLKSTFKPSMSRERQMSASFVAESLFHGISGLINDNEEIELEGSHLEEELSKFLANRNHEYIIDDCVRLHLLLEVSEATTSSPVGSVVREILMKYQPYLSFLPTYPGVIRGNFSSLAIRQTDDYFQKQDCYLFTWKCADENHKAKLRRDLDVSNSALSPFYKTLGFGDHEVIHKMIKWMGEFLEQKLPTTHGPSQANEIFRDILGTAHPVFGTPLEYAYLRYSSEPFADPTERSLTPQHVKIMEILLSREPEIVTRNTAFRNSCPAMVRLDQTFHNALKEKKLEVVETIIVHAPQGFLREDVIIMQLENPSEIGPTTPGSNVLKTLAELLLDLWCENQKVTPNIGNVIIKHDQMQLWKRLPVLSRLREPGIEADIALELLETAFEYKRANFTREILTLFPNVFDTNHALTLVKDGLYDIWELETVKESLKSLRTVNQRLTDDLLVLAIQYKRGKIVQDLLEENQSLALSRSDAPPGYDWKPEEEDVGIYPLWHNNCMFNTPDQGWQERTDRDDPERLNIKTVDQLCFDISLFNSKSYPLEKFARSLPKLTNLPQGALISHSYESVLRYAAFPALGFDIEDDWRGHRSRERDEVFMILRWLRDENKVEEILKLCVLDRMYNPHDEHCIAKYVHEFRVRFLDWRCLELAISVFEEGRGDSVRVIHLYSSGKRATVTHWLGEDGIQSLPNLEEAKIYLIKEAMSQSGMNTIKGVLEKGIILLRAKRPELVCTFEETSWNEQPSRNKSSLSDIARRSVPRLSPFISNYRDHVYDRASRKEQFRPTKVAIIDNGIMNIDPRKYALESPSQQSSETNDPNHYQGGFHRVVKGQSFVDENYTMSSWSFSSDPHGTQMMNLICAIDPCCEVYVAKVVEGRHGIVSDRLARAIQWAISQEVDIISMSLACYEEDTKVNKAVQDADLKGILVLCSAHDEGLNIERTWPACLGETITFAASNQFGRVTHNMRTDAYDFCLHATEIFAGNVPFMQFEEYVSGSSVATAIGAGLSSLIISCHYLANDNRPRHESKWKRDIIKKILEGMQTSPQGSKYVHLDNFCEIAKTIAGGSRAPFDDVLKKHFNVAGDLLGGRELITTSRAGN